MEIELSNGQLKFWQWDTKQKVKVPEGVPSVHFKFGNSAVELPVTDRWVKVPDELLQTGKDILLWTYKEDHTLDAARIPVERRPKPADYIYTPTEIKTWESLDKRIKALEDGGGIAGVSSVNGETGHVTITAEGLGALTEDDLQSATNAALAQAKASGEFDGAPGAPGAPGNDGYSPTVKIEQTDTGATITATDKTGTTTATVKNGQDGAPGSPGQKGDDGLSINWRGEYVESTAYSKNDAVSYDGSAYIMVSNSVIGAVPGIDDDWQLMAQKGGTGAPGPAGAGLDVTGATVGQTVKISAVDDNGVPTAWVPVDMVGGGGEWNTIVDTTLTESAAYNQTMQLAGYHEIVVYVLMPKVESAIQLGPSYSPVGQAGLYYGKIGNTIYKWFYTAHAWCDVDGNIIDSIITTDIGYGVGTRVNITTQASRQEKITNSMLIDNELPAGTQIWIKAR